MPVPNATGTQGSNRPAPASARIQVRSFSANDDHAKPDGAKPPARAASRGGHVPAIPCVRPGALPRSAIRVRPALDPRVPRLLEAVSRGKVERMQNTGGKGRGLIDKPSKARLRAPLTEGETRVR